MKSPKMASWFKQSVRIPKRICQPHPSIVLLFRSELHRCAVFCLLQLDGEIYDTDMVMVDRTLTDICFDNTIVLWVTRCVLYSKTHTCLICFRSDSPRSLGSPTMCNISRPPPFLPCFQSRARGFVLCSSEASPEFELRVELYSCCTEDEFSTCSTPRKLASKLSSSLGRSTGKKMRAAMEPSICSPANNGGAATILLPVPAVP